MSDTVSGFAVILRHPVREEYADEIAAALRMLAPVLRVEPITADLTAEAVAVMRERSELRARLLELAREL